MLDLGDILEQELSKQTVEAPATLPVAPPEPEALIEEENPHSVEALEAGKIRITEIPRNERPALIKQVYEKLSEDEKEAFDLGWRPESLFRGKSRDGQDKPFEDHKKYLDKFKNAGPVLNERLRHEVEGKKALERELEAMREESRKMQELLRRREETELKKEEFSIEAELEEARSLGEVDRALAAERKKAHLERDKLTLKQFEPQAAPTKQEVSSDIIAFGARNPWFQSDDVLRIYAMGYDTQLLSQYGNTLPEAARLKMVEDNVKLKFPDKFSTQAKVSAPGVESARNSAYAPASTRKAGGIGFDQLNEFDKSLAMAMIKKGQTTKEKFMEEHNNSSYAGNSRGRRY